MFGRIAQNSVRRFSQGAGALKRDFTITPVRSIVFGASALGAVGFGQGVFGPDVKGEEENRHNSFSGSESKLLLDQTPPSVFNMHAMLTRKAEKSISSLQEEYNKLQNNVMENGINSTSPEIVKVKLKSPGLDGIVSIMDNAGMSQELISSVFATGGLFAKNIPEQVLSDIYSLSKKSGEELQSVNIATKATGIAGVGITAIAVAEIQNSGTAVNILKSIPSGVKADISSAVKSIKSPINALMQLEIGLGVLDGIKETLKEAQENKGSVNPNRIKELSESVQGFQDGFAEFAQNSFKTYEERLGQMQGSGLEVDSKNSTKVTKTPLILRATSMLDELGMSKEISAGILSGIEVAIGEVPAAAIGVIRGTAVAISHNLSAVALDMVLSPAGLSTDPGEMYLHYEQKRLNPGKGDLTRGEKVNKKSSDRAHLDKELARRERGVDKSNKRGI
jgi:hypothetical protein